MSAGAQKIREAWFGGTFDPVHIGHLVAAAELHAQLDLQWVNLIPCYLSPLKTETVTTAESRIDMLELCCAGNANLRLDIREITRAGRSRTVDTLREIRLQRGDDSALVWAMGWDAFQTLPQWVEWQGVFELANIVVLNRPGFADEIPPTLRKFCAGREVVKEELFEFNFGKLLYLNTPNIEIASSTLREKLARCESVTYFVPDCVAEYIDRNGLYK